MQFVTPFTTSHKTRLPVIMAPMFLVSNESMMKVAIEDGIMGVFPSLNYRSVQELNHVLQSLNEFLNANPGKGSYGVNLIVQKSNPLLEKHLEVCVANKVP